MKRLLLILALVVLMVSSIFTPAMAQEEPPPSHGASFHAAGLTYFAYQTRHIEGRICSVHGFGDKSGMAGIEQDVVIDTDDQGWLTFEVINWYKHVGFTEEVEAGYVLYQWDDPDFYQFNTVEVGFREICEYKVQLDSDRIHFWLYGSDGKLLIYDYYKCENPVMLETIAYIEYWEYPQDGSFYYYGYVTLDDPVNLRGHDSFYRKSVGYDFDMYFIHHSDWGVNWYDKGEIDDR